MQYKAVNTLAVHTQHNAVYLLNNRNKKRKEQNRRFRRLKMCKDEGKRE